MDESSSPLSYVNASLSRPIVWVLAAAVVFVYALVIVFATDGSGSAFSSSTSSSGLTGWHKVGVGVLVFGVSLWVLFRVQPWLGTSVVTYFTNVLQPNPALNIDVTVPTPAAAESAVPVPEIRAYKQVFNIPENDFVYEDAKAMCKAFGARLATYDEVERAYNRGGEWCNYGWSEGQLALFPTQKDTWNKLQQIPGHEQDCGRPGVNGGYMANPHARFGVNCYGYKPRMTNQERALMETEPIYPKTEKDKAMDRRVDYWRGKLQEVLVSPFNHNQWSHI